MGYRRYETLSYTIKIKTMKQTKTINMAQQTMKHMENKTAMQALIDWGDKMMLEHPIKTLSFAEAIDKAVELLELEKRQIMLAVYDSMGTNFDPNMGRAEQYYNEKYGKQ